MIIHNGSAKKYIGIGGSNLESARHSLSGFRLLLDHGVVVGGEGKSNGVARIHLQAGVC
jgi:hypothetical protein